MTAARDRLEASLRVQEGLWSGCGVVVLSQTEIVRRSALDVLCMPSVQRVQMISERALKGQTDKLYFCTVQCDPFGLTSAPSFTIAQQPRFPPKRFDIFSPLTGG